MKNWLIFSSVTFAFAFAACGGKVVVDGLPSGAGGQGGSGTTGSFPTSTGSFPTSTGSFSTSTNVSSAVGSSSISTSSGGTCATCGEAVIGEAKPAELCAGKEAGLFDELLTCACKKICVKQCSQSFCVSFDSTDIGCGNCLMDASNGCGFELKNCFDISG